ncbi:MAG: hypothetical protein IPK13_14170 [Deltaproteobacteria bacterium]|nr:hypothetical protein [Deltaproteobacteria bacterium]
MSDDEARAQDGDPDGREVHTDIQVPSGPATTAGPSSSPSIQPVKLDKAFGEEITDALAADAGEGLLLTRRVDHGTDDTRRNHGITIDDILGEPPVPEPQGLTGQETP